jgi:hypothetical protein
MGMARVKESLLSQKLAVLVNFHSRDHNATVDPCKESANRLGLLDKRISAPRQKLFCIGDDGQTTTTIPFARWHLEASDLWHGFELYHKPGPQAPPEDQDAALAH